MRNYGLIGFPLSHSFSGSYFKEKFDSLGLEDCVYHMMELETLDSLPSLIQQHDLRGFTVTIPHKKNIISLLDHIDPVAEQVGAVNTVKVSEGELTGYNTDIYGFENSLLPLLQQQHNRALVLGTGGAAQAVGYVLDKLSITYLRVSRIPGAAVLAYNEIDEGIMQEYPLVINTTPLGMLPDTESCPALPYDFVTEQHLFYDLIYNPEETKFLMHGATRGATTKNGLEMLHLQADKAWEIWNS